MEALQILEKEMSNLDLDNECIPEMVHVLAKSIPSDTIPYRMKLGLAISELMVFISEFKTNIRHWNGSLIPINSIMFCIAKSGAAKDSSQRAVHKCFDKAYELINQERELRRDALAEWLCRKNGKAVNPTNLAEFTIPLNPLFLSISTPEGFIQQLNDLQALRLGSGFVKSGEIGQDLISNPCISEFIKLLAE
jgi:hypothetical protein